MREGHRHRSRGARQPPALSTRRSSSGSSETGLGTFWHQSCSAKMGRDPMSVVDGTLKIYGLDRVRIADASILPRVTTGNTMAPCVVIGEQAAALLRREMT